MLPKRKPNRLKGYDYSCPGMYFLTICVKDKKCLLGKIVGCGDFDAPQMELSTYGKILDGCIVRMNTSHNHVVVEKYVIMPNHLHLIVSVKEHSRHGASPSAAPYNSEVAKFVSLLKRYCNRLYGHNIWQISYHDHIIRGEADFRKIWEYIDTNVIRWEKDCFSK